MNNRGPRVAYAASSGRCMRTTLPQHAFQADFLEPSGFSMLSSAFQAAPLNVDMWLSSILDSLPPLPDYLTFSTFSIDYILIPSGTF